MSDRTPEQILADWRASERRYTADPTPDLARRIDQLRMEHAAAVQARHVQAEELADLRPRSLGLTTALTGAQAAARGQPSG